MRRRLFVLASLVLASFHLTGCGALAPRDDWSTDNTVAEVSWQLVNVVDAVQTTQIRERADLIEGENLTRHVLGREPKPADAAMYFATMGISHYLISRALPARWRPWFQGATLVYSGSIVLTNCTEHGLLCGGKQ